jgi:hypothetical protein
MKRQTAIRLIRFLFIAQVVSLCVGLLKMVSAMRSGLHIYLLAYLVGLIVGSGLAILWFRQWKGLEAISEEQWNRAWYISPPDPPNNPRSIAEYNFWDGWPLLVGAVSQFSSSVCSSSAILSISGTL